ncbi:hypothetical protein PF008_g12398 [Phytophthora fragariae]|uniref:Uncharacterized protein n=1 Tax=Phytophthora fragariae TaxID=53985 RepID=A0A6G0RPI5_9STRA|nr:hypothetical protein PF008_g12398 [Phytophthora fragariae]
MGPALARGHCSDGVSPPLESTLQTLELAVQQLTSGAACKVLANTAKASQFRAGSCRRSPRRMRRQWRALLTLCDVRLKLNMAGEGVLRALPARFARDPAAVYQIDVPPGSKKL